MPSDQRGLFTIPSGKMLLRALSYLWPAAHAAGFLKNDGSGNLSNAVLALADLPSVPIGMLNATATQSVSNNTWTQMTALQTVINTDSLMGTADQITIQTAGRYLVGGCVAFAANATGSRWGAIYVNGSPALGTGTPIVRRNRASGDASNVAYVGLDPRPVALVATDVLKVFAFQDSGGALNTGFGGEGAGAIQLWASRISA